MNTNTIEKCAVIDGVAIINRDFSIITANEDLYKFIGIARTYSIFDSIHQVDLDDFIDVVNSLRIDQEKSMVIRMKRTDNSYRWTLITVQRKENANNIQDEYVIMHISDIIGMKEQNSMFKDTISNFRHIIALDNDLFFTYEYTTDTLTINSFLDNEIYVKYSGTLEETHKFFIDNNFICKEYYSEYEKLFDDIRKGVVSYVIKFRANDFVEQDVGFTNIEIKGTTIYDEMVPSRTVGSLRNLDDCSKNTLTVNNNSELIDFKELQNYCRKNSETNNNCKLTIVALTIDHLDDIKEQYGKETSDRIYEITLETLKKIISNRGVISEIRYNKFDLVVKGVNSESDIRPFMEHLRTRVSWECYKVFSQIKVTLSLGIARYPENGTNWRIIEEKARFGFNRSINKGGDCFVIFREHLHGEITLDDIQNKIVP